MPERVQSLEDALDRVFLILESSYLSGEYEDEPAFFLLFKDGALFAREDGEPRLLCPWQSNGEKALYVTATRLMAEEYEADMFIFVSEAWSSRTAGENLSGEKDSRGIPIPLVMPSDASDRIEVLILFAGQREGERICHVYEMCRAEDGTLTSFKLNQKFGQDESSKAHSRHDIWNDDNLMDEIRNP